MSTEYKFPWMDNNCQIMKTLFEGDSMFRKVNLLIFACTTRNDTWHLDFFVVDVDKMGFEHNKTDNIFLSVLKIIDFLFVFLTWVMCPLFPGHYFVMTCEKCKQGLQTLDKSLVNVKWWCCVFLPSMSLLFLLLLLLLLYNTPPPCPPKVT